MTIQLEAPSTVRISYLCTDAGLLELFSSFEVVANASPKAHQRDVAAFTLYLHPITNASVQVMGFIQHHKCATGLGRSCCMLT